MDLFDGLILGNIGLADCVLDHESGQTFRGPGRRGFGPFVDSLKKADDLKDKNCDEGIKNDLDQSLQHAFNLEHLGRRVNPDRGLLRKGDHSAGGMKTVFFH